MLKLLFHSKRIPVEVLKVAALFQTNEDANAYCPAPFQKNAISKAQLAVPLHKNTNAQVPAQFHNIMNSNDQSAGPFRKTMPVQMIKLLDN